MEELQRNGGDGEPRSGAHPPPGVPHSAHGQDGTPATALLQRPSRAPARAALSALLGLTHSTFLLEDTEAQGAAVSSRRAHSGEKVGVDSVSAASKPALPYSEMSPGLQPKKPVTRVTTEDKGQIGAAGI